MKFDSINILGVRVDRVTYPQAVEQVREWVGGQGKPARGRARHYIVTPNIEFIMLAQRDKEFRRILNEADLAIPDSSRIGWAKEVTDKKSLIKRLLLLPSCLLPNSSFPTTTGTDLIYLICEDFSKKGFTVGFLGGREGVAKEAAECLKKRYPGLKIVLADDGPMVDEMGNVVSSKYYGQQVDVLFVAFGQGKQEKWIVKNLPTLPVKVAVGVGGAFDYIGGKVPRAPLWMRNLRLEWLFRLIVQPWRIKRQLVLIQFVGKIVAF